MTRRRTEDHRTGCHRTGLRSRRRVERVPPRARTGRWRRAERTAGRGCGVLAERTGPRRRAASRGRSEGRWPARTHGCVERGGASWSRRWSTERTAGRPAHPRSDWGRCGQEAATFGGLSEALRRTSGSRPAASAASCERWSEDVSAPTSIRTTARSAGPVGSCSTVHVLCTASGRRPCMSLPCEGGCSDEAPTSGGRPDAYGTPTVTNPAPSGEKPTRVRRTMPPSTSSLRAAPGGGRGPRSRSRGAGMAHRRAVPAPR